MFSQPKRFSRVPAHAMMLIVLAGMLLCTGCGKRKNDSQTSAPRTTAQRSVRRAYDGAPPIIPHKPLKADCITCHSETGQQVPELGFAAANPHFNTSHAGSLSNCRQCHLFQESTELFAESEFVGIPQEITHGSRAYPGAPPMVPHSKLMRENCLACHSGPSARPEIRCTHTTRTNCVQCHLFQEPGENAFAVHQAQ